MNARFLALFCWKKPWFHVSRKIIAPGIMLAGVISVVDHPQYARGEVYRSETGCCFWKIVRPMPGAVISDPDNDCSNICGNPWSARESVYWVRTCLNIALLWYAQFINSQIAKFMRPTWEKHPLPHCQSRSYRAYQATRTPMFSNPLMLPFDTQMCHEYQICLRFHRILKVILEMAFLAHCTQIWKLNRTCMTIISKVAWKWSWYC